MKIAIYFLFIFLLQESVGLPWHSPRPNNFGVEHHNMNQPNTAYSKIGIFPIGVTIDLSDERPSGMCYKSSMKKCCNDGDLSDAVEAPGDRSVTIGERTIPIRFYQTGIMGSCFYVPENEHIARCGLSSPTGCDNPVTQESVNHKAIQFLAAMMANFPSN